MKGPRMMIPSYCHILTPNGQYIEGDSVKEKYAYFTSSSKSDVNKEACKNTKTDKKINDNCITITICLISTLIRDLIIFAILVNFQMYYCSNIFNVVKIIKFIKVLEIAVLLKRLYNNRFVLNNQI